MSDQVKHDLEIYDDLITSLITLKVILEDIDKITIVKDYNKIKELEVEKDKELEELQFIKFGNEYCKRSKKDIEKEIDLRRQTKKKIDNIEELKEEVKEWEFKSVKILQDLNYEKYDEVVEIPKTELKLERLEISKISINYFRKSVIPKKHLHFVLK